MQPSLAHFPGSVASLPGGQGPQSCTPGPSVWPGLLYCHLRLMLPLRSEFPVPCSEVLHSLLCTWKALSPFCMVNSTLPPRPSSNIISWGNLPQPPRQTQVLPPLHNQREPLHISLWLLMLIRGDCLCICLPPRGEASQDGPWKKPVWGSQTEIYSMFPSPRPFYICNNSSPFCTWDRAPVC